MQNKLKRILSNIKIEIAFIVTMIIIFVIQKYSMTILGKNMDFMSYFSQDRLNGIAAFFAITIGIYIAVITLLATSEISISREILRRNLDKPLIDVMIIGMMENIISVGLSIFIPINQITSFLLVTFLIISLVSFIKFVILLIVIFKENMEQMASAIDEEERYKSAMITYVEEIFKYCQKHNESGNS